MQLSLRLSAACAATCKRKAALEHLTCATRKRGSFREWSAGGLGWGASLPGRFLAALSFDSGVALQSASA
eukprot:7358245-Alexandrium_andersonii.AAC.1